MTLEAEMLEQEEDTQHGRFLTFSVGEEVYGIGIATVTEIVGLQPITAMPEMPEYIKGIINLQGKQKRYGIWQPRARRQPRRPPT